MRPTVASTQYDVIVAGAGPGGSTTAAFLARAGYKVALFDKEKFPRDKPCGDAISGKSVRVLDALGLIDEVEKSPMALANGVRFTSPKGTELVVPFPKPKASAERVAMGKDPFNEPGYVCRREVYDNLVFKAAKKSGAKTFEKTPVEKALMEDGRAVGVQTTNGKQYHADVVVGAGGALCPVARSVGSYERDPKHWVAAIRVYWKDIKDVDDNIEIHFVDDVIPGYFWIFPLDNGLANVGIGMREDYVKQNGKHDLKRLLKHCIEEHPMFKKRFEDAEEMVGSQRGWILPLGSTRRKIHGDGWVTVGDAAGLIDPFSGEGIGNAMLAGQIASQTIDTALQGPGPTETALAPYPERLWREVGDELDRSYKMQRLGRHKWLLNLVVSKAANSEYLQTRLSEMLSDREDTEELTKASFYVKLLFAK
jgi:menaquinone-9 beta-reductase